MESNLNNTATKPWKYWQTPTDAILWAQSELPAHNPQWIKEQWEKLQPDETGKKALVWVRFVLDVRDNEFANSSVPKNSLSDSKVRKFKILKLKN